jgi:hypothetical protein
MCADITMNGPRPSSVRKSLPIPSIAIFLVSAMNSFRAISKLWSVTVKTQSMLALVLVACRRVFHITFWARLSRRTLVVERK